MIGLLRESDPFFSQFFVIIFFSLNRLASTLQVVGSLERRKNMQRAEQISNLIIVEVVTLKNRILMSKYKVMQGRRKGANIIGAQI